MTNTALDYRKLAAKSERQRELPEAVEHYTSSLELEPDGLTYFKRGRCYADLDDDQRAIQDFDEAVARGTRHIQVYYSRAIAHLNLKNYSKAVIDFTQAIRIQPRKRKVSASFVSFSNTLL